MRPLRPMLASPRRQVVFYFLLTFFISWFGALFPVMLLGPSFSGIFLTGRFDGRAGLRDFFSRLAPSRISPILLPALLIPPLLVLAVLILLKTFVSREYTPNHFFVGAGFG